MTLTKAYGLSHTNVNKRAAASTTHLHSQQWHQGRQALPYVCQDLLFVSITTNSDMETASKHIATWMPVGGGDTVSRVLHSQSPELLMAKLKHTIQGESLPQALVQLHKYGWWCGLS